MAPISKTKGGQPSTTTPGVASSSSSSSKSKIPLIVQSTLEKCRKILDLVRSDSTSNPTPSIPSTPSTPSSSSIDLLRAIRNDHLVLAQRIHRSVTNIALGLKQPVSEYGLDTVFEQLRDVVGKIEFGIRELVRMRASCGVDRGSRRRCLDKELGSSTQDLVEALQSFLQTSLQVYTSSTSPSTKISSSSSFEEAQLRDQLLLHTSLVWATVDKTKTISGNELEALSKRWRGVVEVVEDCLDEVKALEQGGGEKEEKEEREDGEDDYRRGHPLNEEEKRRAKACLMLLKMGRLVIKRVVAATSTVAGKVGEEQEGKGFHSDLFQTSADRQIEGISEAADEVASCLEPPHEMDEIGEAVDGFVAHIEGLIERVLDACWEAEADEEDRELMWFNMCKVQVKALEKKVRELLV
ncbi:BQ2448_7534 [Microbotryum intermedium]|uniref:BQ2448_7534 protein n=1 Tax=Microbotryum intermedium TaxID=269621 RepID=A0A238FMW3_9BASI|nr:BQ2448_7534 [Microbotryum intermedium]